jgi:hypothetical protein
MHPLSASHGDDDHVPQMMNGDNNLIHVFRLAKGS